MTRYGRDIRLKETLRSEARGYHKLKKQNGGPGQFAIVDLLVRPLPRGGGFRFLNSVVEGRIPEDFVPSLEKGAREATAKGSLAGFPVVDIEVEVVDGAHHRKDSHGRDFQTAGWMAVQDALRTGASALLEPFGSLVVSCPTPAVGAVMGRLRSRRVRIRGTDFRDNLHIVEGDIPLLEAAGLDDDLRSMTSGVATVTIAPSHDELMPFQVMSLVLEQLRRK